MNTFLYPPPVAYLLAALLFALLFLRMVSEEVRPIFRAVTAGLTKTAAKNANVYAIAGMFGLSASLSAFYDMFQNLTVEQAKALSYWQIAACWAKIFNPFVVASLAYVLKPTFPGDANREPTNPPFQPTQS